MVGVSGGVWGCGFFCWVACEGGLLVEWDGLCWSRSVLPARPRFVFGMTPLGGNVKGVRIALVRWDRSKV